MIDPTSGRVVSEYAMVGSIEDLAFSPDGLWLATGNGSPPPEILSAIRREEEQKEKLEHRQKIDKFRLNIQQAFDNDNAMHQLIDIIRAEIKNHLFTAKKTYSNK
jgi:hypothetical protein